MRPTPVFWKVVSLFVGSRWRAFCGLSREGFAGLATTTLDALDYEYAIEETATSGGERAMLGAEDEGCRIAVTSPASFEIDVVDATVDPVTNVALSFLTTEQHREELTTDLCVVTLSPIDEETRPAMARIMTRVMAASDRPPWKLTHHVKFRLAVLLRLKVKVLWEYWRRVDS